MLPYQGGLHGAYLRSDLERQLGPRRLRVELADGVLTPFAKNVVVDRAQAAAFHTRAAAALLHAGPEAVLTSHTALRLHGCTAADLGPIHVLVPVERRLRSRADLAVHRAPVAPADVEEILGMRVQRLIPTLTEFICRERPRPALACLDQALAAVAPDDRLDMRARIARLLYARADIRGTRRATMVLELATGLPESPIESWIVVILAEAGIAAPVLQYSVRDLAGHERYRLDFAWPELKVALEYDGYEAHEGRAELDRARDEDLRRRGWLVVRADSADLGSPGRLLRELRTAFRQRRTAA
jgi:hypothetical protein